MGAKLQSDLVRELYQVAAKYPEHASTTSIFRRAAERIELLERHLKVMTDELRDEVEANYSFEARTHPHYMRKYEADMETVRDARRALDEENT